ncbi:hypothetical protein ACFV47_16565 [Streptomyces solisilvae]|uniref:hypothetical protein n=1 Tax=Streptomyces malaysiensis TaxID=92644 RepID=UPI0036C00948
MLVFDQRVAALVRLKGTDADCELLEETCEQRGWPVLRRPQHPPSGQSANVLYLIEVRIPGARFRAVHGARVKVEELGDQLVLDLQVEAAEAVDRDPVPDQSWMVYASRESALGQPPSHTWRAKWERRAVIKGRRDTGRAVRARDEVDALRKAREKLPGTPDAPAGVRVRKGDAKDYYIGRRTQERHEIWLIHLCLVNLVLVGLVREHPVFWAAVGGMAVICIWAALPLRKNCLTALMAWGPPIWLGWNATESPLFADTKKLAAVGGLYAFGAGLLLLVRTWSWREWGPWLIPVLFPVLLSFFPGVGFLVHTFYLKEFGLASGDVDVPLEWQFVASAKVVGAMSLWLLMPAAWGYLKHFHVVIQDRWIYGIMTVWLAVSVFAGAPNEFVIDPATDAGKAAQDTTKRGDTPASYYGIESEWICASPLTGLDKLPSQGGTLHPSRSYLLLGDANGTAALWDRNEEAALKIPLNKIRVTPQPDPDKSCP